MRGAPVRSVGHTHFSCELRSLGVLGAAGVPSGFGEPEFSVLALGALEAGTLGFVAPTAADSGSGRGLLTCGVVVDGDTAGGGGAGGGTAGLGAGVGAGLDAVRGVARSGDGAPGPNAKTWPTEMRKSPPMLFHRAKSRKSRS